MYRLLLVEGSKTLRHVLARVFSGSPYDTDSTTSYVGALQMLRQASVKHAGYDAIILGWPFSAEIASDELLTLLGQKDFTDLFVLVLTHDNLPGARTWVATRPNSGFLFWNNYQDIIPTIDRVAADREKPAALYSEEALVNTGRRAADDTRVLFVDDSPASRVFFRRLLVARGYKVDTASGVSDALNKLGKINYDIAIIDYYLPEYTGDRLCTMIKDNPRTAGITCAIITGSYTDHIIKDCLHAGAVECMFKNEASELFLAQIDAISRAVRGSRSVFAKEQLLEGILSSVGDGVYGVDSGGKITFINAAARRFLGFADDDPLVGHNAQEELYFPGMGGDLADIDSHSGQPTQNPNRYLTPVEFTFKRKSGEAVSANCSVYPLRIKNRNAGIVVAFREATKDSQQEDRLWWYATHDPVTKLLNRRYFEVQLETELHRLRRTGTSSVLVFLHVEIVSRSGDTTFDEVFLQYLERVAGSLMKHTGQNDLLAHVGQGSFAVILRDVDANQTDAIGDRFQAILDEASTSGNDHDYAFTGSTGVVSIDKEARTPNEILARAHLAQQLSYQDDRDRIRLVGARAVVPGSKNKVTSLLGGRGTSVDEAPH